MDCQKFGVSSMKVKITVGAIIFFLVGTFGLMVYDVSKMDSESLILCALDEGGILVPSELCEYYMFNYRAIKNDIEELASGAGLIFILNGENKEKKYKFAKFFILNGLDVNGVNHYGEDNLTPLHGAVLINDVELVNFLLKHGADINIKPPSINMTPLELARLLQENEPSVDRRKVVQALID